MRIRLPLAAGALLASLSLASCAADASPQSAPTSPAAPQTTEPAPAATATSAPPEESTPEPVADPTCETIISSGTAEALTEQGWTYEQEEFRIGETLVEEGLLCMWADFSTASDHGQMYAWGPISAPSAETAMAGLQRDGWLRSSAGGRQYFTEDPAYALATDSDGFGMTYEFGDGWVKFADTKQSLLLIDWEG
ncbi:hypothetical protein PTQ19_06135 [Microbacterium esteraromaticum]|uniref:hypothetical protein n=1 Tax=Microbacterium esteraromaticum TaxID=57043 RepID=UPI002368D189|nr:hypothetical protein [Microbacterium esteraromaticum]WDH80013.1 hypothetical protein PTQ19_06135 [Microbacterium esteraromaticum]